MMLKTRFILPFMWFLFLISLCFGNENNGGINHQIKSRWDAFENTHTFRNFEIGRSDEELIQEFQLIQKTRESIWQTEKFTVANHLLQKDLVRAPGCIAFEFNNTDPDYNASTMCLGNKNYIACEGPRSKDIPNFFNLITTQKVTHLVRLTDAFEGEIKKCHPYWKDILLENDDGSSFLQIPSEQDPYRVEAYDMAYWRDNQGVDPSKLLELALTVRNALNEQDLLLVHCSAGVGRTGTFLATLAIIDAIDKGEPFSIEEIVYRLSLQRAHSVGKSSQYITLHRVAETYLIEKAYNYFVVNGNS